MKALTKLTLASPLVLVLVACYRRGLLFPSVLSGYYSRMFQQQRPSLTAEIVCVSRAIATALKYIDDPFAYHFLDLDAKAWVWFFLFCRTVLGKHWWRSQLLTMMTIRTKAFDEFIDNSESTQVVILGAGLDSKAYRLNKLPQNVRFFEVDAPATQNMKKEKVAQIYRQNPELFTNKAFAENRVGYVSCNFASNESFMDRLVEHGFDKNNSKTVILLEGVAGYLTWNDLKGTLEKIASCKSGTLFAMNVPRSDQGARWFTSFLKYIGEERKFTMKIDDTAENLFGPIGFDVLDTYDGPAAFNKFAKCTGELETFGRGPTLIFMRVK